MLRPNQWSIDLIDRPILRQPPGVESQLFAYTTVDRAVNRGQISSLHSPQKAELEAFAGL